MKSQGLSRISSEQLKRILALVYRKQLSCPITRSGLIAAALGDVEQQLDILVGLDERAVQRVIVAVLAERRAI
jgi:hypothetical protein